ncbi:hypothetical protein L218DRAFT_770267 [Marasmius fiardii PR-910]|nr:hypothetical protein L218DRAFT_770267 [Marasmius fiardii PR-910]
MSTIFPDVHFRALKAPMKTDELLKTLRSDATPNPHLEISHFIQNVEHDLNLYDKLILICRPRRQPSNAMQIDIALSKPPFVELTLRYFVGYLGLLRVRADLESLRARGRQQFFV